MFLKNHTAERRPGQTQRSRALERANRELKWEERDLRECSACRVSDQLKARKSGAETGRAERPVEAVQGAKLDRARQQRQLTGGVGSFSAASRTLRRARR